MWSEENPNATIKAHSQYKHWVNVGCGTYDKKIIGPYVFAQRLLDEIFLEFLLNILAVMLDDWDIDLAGMYFK